MGEIDARAKRDGGEDGQLVPRIGALDLEAGIRPGITLGLRLEQDVGIVAGGLFPRLGDKLAGAVRNSVNPPDSV